MIESKKSTPLRNSGEHQVSTGLTPIDRPNRPTQSPDPIESDIQGPITIFVKHPSAPTAPWGQAVPDTFIIIIFIPFLFHYFIIYYFHYLLFPFFIFNQTTTFSVPHFSTPPPLPPLSIRPSITYCTRPVLVPSGAPTHP